MVRWSINITYHEDSQILFFGRIHTCLEEAENERMHLMCEFTLVFCCSAVFDGGSDRTFMTLRQPSILLRALVLGAQGVFYNLFCTSFVFFFFVVLTYTLHQFYPI
jgi:hypothetical protein